MGTEQPCAMSREREGEVHRSWNIKKRIQDGECVCDTRRKKVLLQDVKLCPTWKVNEVKCPDLRFMILLPSCRARGIGVLHTKNNQFDSHRR